MAPVNWHDRLTRLGTGTLPERSKLDLDLPAEGFCILDDTSLLAVDGPDAETFLQGQLTCDVRDLGEGAVHPAAHLNPKGRVIASFLAWRRNSTFYMSFPATLEDAVVRRLRMFLLRSKATIAPPEPALAGIGAWGEAAVATVGGILDGMPGAPWLHAHRGGISLITLPGPAPRVEVVLPVDEAARLADRLAGEGATCCETTAWRLLDIRSGIGWVRPSTSEAFLPQMLNYDCLGGISFSKGCYVGQEVVARLHHLGEVKRRAYPGSVDAVAPPPGTPIVAEDGSSRQAGTVVDAIELADGGCELLAVVEKRARAAGGLHVGEVDGPQLTLRDPPYPFAATGSAARSG